MAMSLGSMLYNKTGAWRNIRPEIDLAECIQCGICWKFCPDASIDDRGRMAGRRLRLLQGVRHLRRGMPDEVHRHGRGGEMKKVIMGNHALSYGAMLSRVPGHRRLPHHAPDPGRRASLGDVRRRDARRQVHQGRVRALGHGRLHRRLAGRGPDLHRHVVPGARPDARAAPLGLGRHGCPVVMGNINRAMAPGWSIWTDQNDSLSQRDTGWMQFYCASNQEVLDTVIQAFKVSEKLLIPSMVILDAFALSHTYEVVDIPDQAKVDAYLPPFKPPYRLTPSEPARLLRADRARTLFRTPLQAPEGHGEGPGRDRGDGPGVREGLRPIPRARRRLPVRRRRHSCSSPPGRPATRPGSPSTSCARDGIKAGNLRMKVFRPFPFDEVRRIAERGQESGRRRPQHFLRPSRHLLPGSQIGPLRPVTGRPAVFGYVAGLGGRDITPGTSEEIVGRPRPTNRPDEEIVWIGVKR